MKGFSFIVLAAFLWALDSLIRYPLLQTGIKAEVLVFYEHVILCVIFSFYSFRNFSRFLKMEVEDLIYFIIIGVGGSAAATLCFTEAFTFINPSLVILIQKFQPIVAVILAKFFLGEKIRPKFMVWASICLTGVVLISGKDLVHGFSQLEKYSLSEVDTLKGYGLTLLAVIGWGASTVFSKKLTLKGYSEKDIMGGRFFLALMALAPYVLYKGSDISISQDISFKILGLVLISGLGGMYFYYKGLKYVSARVCTLGELFFPLGAVFLNWLFLDVSVQPIQILGGSLLLFGASLIQYKKY